MLTNIAKLFGYANTGPGRIEAPPMEIYCIQERCPHPIELGALSWYTEMSRNDDSGGDWYYTGNCC